MFSNLVKTLLFCAVLLVGSAVPAILMIICGLFVAYIAFANFGALALLVAFILAAAAGLHIGVAALLALGLVVLLVSKA